MSKYGYFRLLFSANRGWLLVKVEWHPGERFPRVGFAVTNLPIDPDWIIHFDNQRGTVEQHIKEGKQAIKRTRLRRTPAVLDRRRSTWVMSVQQTVGMRSQLCLNFHAIPGQSY